MKIARTRRAFTLVELLVIVAIIALLSSLLLASTSRLKVQRDKVLCMQNMREVFYWVELYAQENGGSLPAPLTNLSTGQTSWWTLVGLFKNPKYSTTDPTLNAMYQCPVAKRTFPAGNTMRTYGLNTEGQSATLSMPIVRNTMPSTTLLVIDIKRNSGSDSYPYFRYTQTPYFTEWVDARHDGLFNALFLDGHVELLSPTDPQAKLYITNFGK